MAKKKKRKTATGKRRCKMVLVSGKRCKCYCKGAGVYCVSHIGGKKKKATKRKTKKKAKRRKTRKKVKRKAKKKTRKKAKKRKTRKKRKVRKKVKRRKTRKKVKKRRNPAITLPW